ncbi:oligosaccharide flippase family protein [Microbacterium sp. 10M-3C3]|uniref:oligosaccharide flippase family protein n=1 Tax=Microbacterium sp. 10M-3C3 TaxID=2483401 RepID=UPI000F62CD88|nr:oligosaccharide flippase family protein [Microbacterium sp. 10M-3C3]
MSAPVRLASQATRGVAWSGINTIVLRLGGVVVGIVLARLLTPEQFGVYAVALTVQAILMTVADLGLSADIIRSDEPERIAPTVATLGLVSGGVLTLVAVAGAAPLASALGSPAAAPAIAILSLTLLLGGATVVPYGLLQRRFQQRELFLMGAVDFVVSTGVTLALVAVGWGVLGLAVGRVVAQTVSTVLLFLLARVRPRYGIDRAGLRPVLAFGLPIAAANLLSWALLNVDNIVLARVAGATALGFYVLAFNISNWPMSAMSQMVRSIALPYFSRLERPADGLPTVVSFAWAGALPAGVALAVLAAPVIHVLYGERWLPAAAVLAALGLYGGLRVLFDVFAGYLYAQGRSRPVLWVQLATLAVLVAAMVPAILLWGIVGAGWAHLVVGLAVILPGYLVVLHAAGARIRSLLRALVRPTLAAVPAAAVAVVVRLWIADAAAALLIGGSLFVVVYLAVMGPWLRRRIQALRSSGD